MESNARAFEWFSNGATANRAGLAVTSGTSCDSTGEAPAGFGGAALPLPAPGWPDAMPYAVAIIANACSQRECPID